MEIMWINSESESGFFPGEDFDSKMWDYADKRAREYFNDLGIHNGKVSYCFIDFENKKVKIFEFKTEVTMSSEAFDPVN